MCKDLKHEHTHEHCHEHAHEHFDEEHTHEHCHEHTHEHCHEHSHGDDHCHEHTHDHGECCCDGNSTLDKEEKTLKILLSHWIDHNKSHEEGFREWVEKSKKMGKAETAKYIEEAIKYMEKANEMLKEAGDNI